MSERTRWEYNVARLEPTPEWIAEYGHKGIDVCDSNIGAWLEGLGADGWELVKIEVFGWQAYAVLKRPAST